MMAGCWVDVVEMEDGDVAGVVSVAERANFDVSDVHTSMC